MSLKLTTASFISISAFLLLGFTSAANSDGILRDITRIESTPYGVLKFNVALSQYDAVDQILSEPTVDLVSKCNPHDISPLVLAYNNKDVKMINKLLSADFYFVQALVKNFPLTSLHGLYSMLRNEKSRMKLVHHERSIMLEGEIINQNDVETLEALHRQYPPPSVSSLVLSLASNHPNRKTGKSCPAFITGQIMKLGSDADRAEALKLAQKYGLDDLTEILHAFEEAIEAERFRIAVHAGDNGDLQQCTIS